ERAAQDHHDEALVAGGGCERQAGQQAGAAEDAHAMQKGTAGQARHGHLRWNSGLASSMARPSAGLGARRMAVLVSAVSSGPSTSSPRATMSSGTGRRAAAACTHSMRRTSDSGPIQALA